MDQIFQNVKTIISGGITADLLTVITHLVVISLIILGVKLVMQAMDWRTWTTPDDDLMDEYGFTDEEKEAEWDEYRDRRRFF